LPFVRCSWFERSHQTPDSAIYQQTLIADFDGLLT
jgi:hypothetical protein